MTGSGAPTPIMGRLDCVVRFHDATRLIELDRCVFSLYGQAYRPLHVHIVTQRFSQAELRRVEETLAPLREMPDAATFSVVNFTGAVPADARSELLNLGISRSQGQYMAFLDYDDTLYPEAYALLVERLRASKAAIVFASVRAMNADVHTEGGFVQPVGMRDAEFNRPGPKDIIAGNFCPLHSYVIDRTRIDGDVLRVDPTLKLEEDYDLLLRICMAYPSDFSLLGTFIGDYVFKSDGSNSTNVGMAPSGNRAALHEWARAQMQARRDLEHLGKRSTKRTDRNTAILASDDHASSHAKDLPSNAP